MARQPMCILAGHAHARQDPRAHDTPCHEPRGQGGTQQEKGPARGCLGMHACGGTTRTGQQGESQLPGRALGGTACVCAGMVWMWDLSATLGWARPQGPARGSWHLLRQTQVRPHAFALTCLDCTDPAAGQRSLDPQGCLEAGQEGLALSPLFVESQPGPASQGWRSMPSPPKGALAPLRACAGRCKASILQACWALVGGHCSVAQLCCQGMPASA